MNGKYQKGEYCEANRCPNYDLLMSGDNGSCYECKAFNFQNWLSRNGYEIHKKEAPPELKAGDKRAVSSGESWRDPVEMARCFFGIGSSLMAENNIPGTVESAIEPWQVWTKDFPTEAGLYRFRRSSDHISQALNVCKRNDYFGVVGIVHSYFKDGQWAGPVPEPVDSVSDSRATAGKGGSK